ncbi:MAG: hypothetical protein KatS3mg121_0035 [Gammaproteobacteria bacterium]|nr:MAG: hypothetical protein KatS3mg121_0035 [Gammaproteobacteria bacterium]
MKKAFWKRDGVLGLLTAAGVLLVHSCTTLVDGLEREVYDLGVRGAERAPGDAVAIVAIDDASIDNLGRWPWPRDLHAGMIRKLSAAGAKVIAYSPVFAEPQRDPGLAYIERLDDTLRAAGLSAAEGAPRLAEHRGLIGQVGEDALRAALEGSLDGIAAPLAEADRLLGEARTRLDVDRQLAEAMREAGNVVSPMWFLFGPTLGRPDAPLPEAVRRMALTRVEDPMGVRQLGESFLPLSTQRVIAPIPAVAEAARALGNINNAPDIDGGTRGEALVVEHYGELYPSYALMVAAASLNLGPEDIVVRLGQGVSLGGLDIRTDSRLRMLTFFYPPGALAVDSFFDVWADKVRAEKYRGKTVIVGVSASGLGNPQLTPISPALSEPETLAHTVASLLNGDFFTRPAWASWLTAGAVLAVVLYLCAVLPALGAGAGAVASALLLLALLAGEYLMLAVQATWLPLTLPAVLLVVGHLVLSTRRFLATERGKRLVDLESAESNKMLGLALQGQGQLDMAFEKFRKCPRDPAMAEVLYNLALDYERKRQFAKAGHVYRYIAEFAPDFRDVQARIARAEKMENTVVLGGGATASGTLILDEAEKPMLGRYQVERELGKGAMGVVYLGRDPKINRIVAIKTLALSQEFDEDELAEVKARFFREAETAGRLNHPNIVTIYDAGEEHDLAYIAMEFLDGHDLGRYTKRDRLLPLPEVIRILQKAAEALDYAHRQNVVHRDVKPANVMYNPDTGLVKLTDFGIARITDSSRTKTGMVLGTPSYMSPEQLAGKKVDGRSDIFSLGVMFFQMVTGDLPFKADSMAALLYKIANEPHPSVLDLNPELPPLTEVIIAKAMEKNPDDRYQTAAELARDLGRLLEEGR